MGVSLPAPGEGAPLSPLRGSEVIEGEKVMLRLLLLWGLEKPLRDGEREPISPLLFSGNMGTGPLSPPRFRLPRPSTASSRLCSRSPFPNSNKEDKSVLSVPLQTSKLPPRLFRGSRGELWAFGVRMVWGGEGWGGYGEFRELGVRSCHTGGGVELEGGGKKWLKGWFSVYEELWTVAFWHVTYFSQLSSEHCTLMTKGIKFCFHDHHVLRNVVNAIHSFSW